MEADEEEEGERQVRSDPCVDEVDAILRLLEPEGEVEACVRGEGGEPIDAMRTKEMSTG